MGLDERVGAPQAGEARERWFCERQRTRGVEAAGAVGMVNILRWQKYRFSEG